MARTTGAQVPYTEDPDTRTLSSRQTMTGLGLALVAASVASTLSAPPAHADALATQPLNITSPTEPVPMTPSPVADATPARPADLPTPSAAPASTSGGTSYTVKAGDTVSGIAARTGVSQSAIISANGLNSRATIRIGQQLTIPSHNSSAPSTATTSTSGGTSYTVKAGDTVSGIAARTGVSQSAIISANGLNSRATIRIGQQLTLPTTQSVVPSTFAGRTYPSATVDAANQNKQALTSRPLPSKSEMKAMIASVAAEMGVDPAIALAIAHQESGFSMSAVSPANAIGAMQVIPSSGKWASQLVGRELDLLDPHDNVVAGVAIIRSLLKSAPDQGTAIAGYYQGLSSVQRNGMYDDTKRYVANVQSLMSRYA